MTTSVPQKSIARDPHQGFARLVVLLLGTIVLLLAGISVARAADEELVIIVHPSVHERSLERRFVADAFLKKRTRWASDAVIKPVDLDPDSPVRERFSGDILQRSVSAVRRYWQQRIFSGRDVPPPEVSSTEAATRYVASHEGAIGYVSKKTELKGVRVVELR